MLKVLKTITIKQDTNPYTNEFMNLESSSISQEFCEITPFLITCVN